MKNPPRRPSLVALLTASLTLTASFAPAHAPAVVQPGPALAPDGIRWVEKTMRRMTLEDKVGQMIGCRYSGEFLPADGDQLAYLKRLVSKHKIGSLAIFLGEAYETAILNNTLQAAADVPLLLGSDLERGAGNQISGATLFPTIMGLGASGSEDLAYAMGRTTALEGRAVGLHMVYAPVVDVNINPDNPIINTRAVGEDPALVARIAAAFTRGCQDNGMIATAKHFPGHGDTDQDSHILLPVIRADRARLDRVELAPYRRLIEEGVGAIMVSHLTVPALDPTPGLPATLSPVILTGLLRGEMGFRGLIVTDAMEMGGVTNAYTPADAALKAIQAGVDIVLLPLEPETVVESLKDAVRKGVLTRERVDASVRRILEAKARLGLHRNRLVDIASLPSKLGTKSSLDQAARTFEAAVTLVKNEGGVLPLSLSGKRLAVFSLSSDKGEYYAGRTFADAVKARHAGTQIFYADGDTGREALYEAVLQSAGADAYLVALFSSLSAWKGSVGLDPRHVELVRLLAAGDKPVIVLSFGSPYFLRDFPGVDAYLCLYRNQPQMQTAAAKAVFGEIDVAGKLPVSIPDLAPTGTGVVLKKRPLTSSFAFSPH
jgi:beta-N-acetylhexosaminidase